MSDSISIDPDKAANAVRLIARGQEAAGSLEVHTKGVSVGPTSDFKNMLISWVLDTQKALTEIEQQLASVQSNVTKTVVELGERDAALASETATFQAGVADIAVPPTSAPAPGSGPSTTPNSSGKTVLQ